MVPKYAAPLATATYPPAPVAAVISALGGLAAIVEPKYSYLSEFKNFILANARQQPELLGAFLGA